jgi:integrase
VVKLNQELILSDDQLDKLLDTLRKAKHASESLLDDDPTWRIKCIRNVLDYYLFTIMSYTGMKISESLLLKVEDIKEGFLTVKTKNGDVDEIEIVVFGKKTDVLFRELIEFRNLHLPGVGEFLFSTSTVAPHRSYAHTRFKHWLKKAQLNRDLSLNSLRHTYITQCLGAGVTPNEIRQNIRKKKFVGLSQYQDLVDARNKLKKLF